MRTAPFSAAEDPLLLRMFGADALAGRTVLCVGGGGTPEGDWVVAVTEGADGFHALECLGRHGGQATVSERKLTSQSDWLDVFGRATDPTMEPTVEFSTIDWMNAQIAIALSDPDWDEVAAGMAWEEAAERTEAELAAVEEKVRRIEGRTTDEILGDMLQDFAETGAPPLDDRAREILRAMVELSGTAAPGTRPH